MITTSTTNTNDNVDINDNMHSNNQACARPDAGPEGHDPRGGAQYALLVVVLLPPLSICYC